MTLSEKVTALLALAFKLPECADEIEQDALTWAVFKAVTGQQSEGSETVALVEEALKQDGQAVYR